MSSCVRHALFALFRAYPICIHRILVPVETLGFFKQYGVLGYVLTLEKKDLPHFLTHISYYKLPRPHSSHVEDGTVILTSEDYIHSILFFLNSAEVSLSAGHLLRYLIE